MVKTINSMLKFDRSKLQGLSKSQIQGRFIYKLKIVEEEADESIYWLELFQEVLTPSKKEVKPLIKEANELLAMVVVSIKTARKNNTTNK